MSRPNDPEPNLPLYEPEDDSAYSLEIVARIAGVSTETILHYTEQGLIPSRPDSGKSPVFDDQALLTLRRIEQLRSTCEANTAGLKLILELMDQVDRLKTALRSRR